MKSNLPQPHNLLNIQWFDISIEYEEHVESFHFPKQFTNVQFKNKQKRFTLACLQLSNHKKINVSLVCKVLHVLSIWNLSW